MKVTDLICKHSDCKLIYENPVLLPCGGTLCQHHLDDFDNLLKFKCFFCNGEHELTNYDYNQNEKIINMIQSYFDLNPLRKEIKDTFNYLNQKLIEYEQFSSDGYIYDYFEDVRNKVDLHREELKNEIDKRSDEIIRQLKEKEETFKLNSSRIKKMDLDNLKTSNLPSWKNKFRLPEINKKELNDLKSKMNEQIKSIQNEMKRYKNKLLSNETIRFEKYDENSIIFGKVVVELNEYNIQSEDFGKLIRNFNQHSDLVRSIQVDEKSNKLISASIDKTIKIWNFENGYCIKTLYDHQSWVTCLLIISNNKFISGSCDKTIKIWDFNSYECLNTIKTEVWINSFCLVSDNNQVACGCQDGSIQIWNFNDPTRLIKSFKAHSDWIPYLKSIHNYQHLISCSGLKDNKIKIWDLETFKCVKELTGHSNTIYYLEEMALNDYLLSCSEDKTVKLWNMKTCEMIQSIKFEYPVYCVKFLFKKLIAVGLGNDKKGGEIIVFNFEKLKKIRSIQNPNSFIYQLHILSNDNLIGLTGKGDIKLWKFLE